MRVPALQYLPGFLSEILRSFSISRKTFQLHSVSRTNIFRIRSRREMITIDTQTATKLQPELFTGERIHWAAMPNPKIIFIPTTGQPYL
jgi:hypothetical protein